MHLAKIYDPILKQRSKWIYRLVETEQQAQEIHEQLMHQMAICAGITEQLKATNQMAWAQKINAISNQVREIVSTELILV